MQWKRESMTDILKPSDLQIGDVLLYWGRGFIADLIRIGEGSGAAYSHAAIYDGSHVMESLTKDGIEVNDPVRSIAGGKYVDVFRFRGADGAGLASATHPTQPVADRIAYYEAHRASYAYDSVILLAVLCATRQVNFGASSLVVRRILDSAAAEVDAIVSVGKEPVICSELVYRCYAEAGPGSYRLQIVGSDVVVSAAQSFLTPVEPAAVPADDVALRISAQSFLTRYAMAKGAATTSAEGFAVPVLTTANFVTPFDLGRSPSLVRIGTVQA